MVHTIMNLNLLSDLSLTSLLITRKNYQMID